MKSITAYAIVDKKNPVIKIKDIYDTKDVVLLDTEKIIKITISEKKD